MPKDKEFITRIDKLNELAKGVLAIPLTRRKGHEEVERATKEAIDQLKSKRCKKTQCKGNHTLNGDSWHNEK